MTTYPTLNDTIVIDGGTIAIGNDALPLSRPVHHLKIAPFRMMIGTVSNQHYAAFVGDGGYRRQTLWTAMGWRWRQSKSVLVPAYWSDAGFNRPTQPIVGIGWYEAQAFATWLATLSKHLWRLPTEIEWEAAAQGNGTGAIHFAGDGIPHTIDSIGQGYQSDKGLWNMRGNIWEWCSTCWGRNWQTLNHAYPYQADDGREDLSGSHARIMRGGSWFDPLQESHISKRGRFLPGSRASNIGFRLVCDVTM